MLCYTIHGLRPKRLIVIGTLKEMRAVTPVKHTCSSFDKRGHEVELQTHYKH